ncbi:recombinase family protein [Psychromonas sp. L1A2]|uniref:recombinase family protein n=1 Tax=Psychromonas sp. L1A2 TaxID=2686356 RepID=UPI0013594E82|nr:recombinase family protein [Psychromonas sp. L1A2]
MSVINTNKNKKSITKNIRFERVLIEAIENNKEPFDTFSSWVKKACIEQLKRMRVNITEQQFQDISEAKSTSKANENLDDLDDILDGILEPTLKEKETLPYNKEKIVIFISEMRINGHSDHFIANQLNEKGIRTFNDRKWHQNNVKSCMMRSK